MQSHGEFVIQDRSRRVRLVASLLLLVLPGLLMAWTVLRLGIGETTAYATAGAGVFLAMLGVVFAGLGSRIIIDRAKHGMVETITLLGVPVKRKSVRLGKPQSVVLRTRSVVLNPHDRERRAPTTYSYLFVQTTDGELPVNNHGDHEMSIEVGQGLARYLGVNFTEERMSHDERRDLTKQPLRIKVLVGIVVLLLVGGALYRLADAIVR